MTVQEAALGAHVSLDPVMQRVCEAVSRVSGELREACSHLFEAGGKGVRPALVILSARAAREAARPNGDARGLEPEIGEMALAEAPGAGLCGAMYDVAAAAEMIHVASLIHDDIIDGAPVRRDRPSVNARWNNHTAVLAGDALFAAAFRLLEPYASLGALAAMTEAISAMCQGEMLQRQQAFDPDVTERAYRERIEGKTAALIAACCEVGARLGGADPEGARGMREFGLHLGLAYQVIDDVLDFDGSAEAMGKPVCADLKEGCLTLPVIYLLRHPDWRSRLAPRIKRREIDEATVASVRDGVKETGALQAAVRCGEEFARTAAARLGPLGTTPAGKRLASLAWAAVSRNA